MNERDIALQMRSFLREHSGACAEGNVHGWRWVRYADGEYRAVRYTNRGERHLNEYVVGRVLESDSVLDWMLNKPVQLIPVSEAYLWGPSKTTVWEDADEQDVFTDCERCFWCGGSDRTHDLTEYETVEDGDVNLCHDCYESWDTAGELVTASAN